MGISSALSVGSVTPGVCTSSTRPANPFEGQMIYETDTDKVLVWNGSAWYANWNLPWGVVGYANKASNTNVSTTTADMSGLSVTWTAVSGRVYRTSFHGIGSVDTANGYITVSIANSSNGTIQLIRGTGGSSAARFSVSGFVYETGLSGSTTRKARADVNTGNGLLDGATGYPQQIIVEDIGPA